MDGDLVAVAIAILAGIFAVAWLCWKVIYAAMETDRIGPPVLHLQRLRKEVSTTVKGVICPHCAHKFDVPITIE